MEEDDDDDYYYYYCQSQIFEICHIYQNIFIYPFVYIAIILHQ